MENERLKWETHFQPLITEYNGKVRELQTLVKTHVRDIYPLQVEPGELSEEEYGRAFGTGLHTKPEFLNWGISEFHARDNLVTGHLLVSIESAKFDPESAQKAKALLESMRKIHIQLKLIQKKLFERYEKVHGTDTIADILKDKAYPTNVEKDARIMELRGYAKALETTHRDILDGILSPKFTESLLHALSKSVEKKRE